MLRLLYLPFLHDHLLIVGWERCEKGGRTCYTSERFIFGFGQWFLPQIFLHLSLIYLASTNVSLLFQPSGPLVLQPHLSQQGSRSGAISRLSPLRISLVLAGRRGFTAANLINLSQLKLMCHRHQVRISPLRHQIGLFSHPRHLSYRHRFKSVSW